MNTYLKIAVASALIMFGSFAWRDRSPRFFPILQFASGALALYTSIQWLGLALVRKR